MVTSTAPPLTTLVTEIERLTENIAVWPTDRLIDEGLDIVRDHCWAVSSVLYRRSGQSVIPVRRRPNGNDHDDHVVDPGWFPWGLGGTKPERFMFIGDAGALPLVSDSVETLADRGITSCAHLPLVERGQPVGYLQIHWGETRLVWNDDAGRILRVLGRFLLGLCRVGGVEVGQSGFNDVVPLEVARHERLDDRCSR